MIMDANMVKPLIIVTTIIKVTITIVALMTTITNHLQLGFGIGDTLIWDDVVYEPQ